MAASQAQQCAMALALATRHGWTLAKDTREALETGTANKGTLTWLLKRKLAMSRRKTKKLAKGEELKPYLKRARYTLDAGPQPQPMAAPEPQPMAAPAPEPQPMAAAAPDPAEMEAMLQQWRAEEDSDDEEGLFEQLMMSDLSDDPFLNAMAAQYAEDLGLELV